MRRVFVNGIEGAGLPADDPGLTLGLNVFDTLRTYGRRPYRLDQHLVRLEASAAHMGIPVPRGLREELLGLVGDDVVLRVMLTAGGNRVIEVSAVDHDRVRRPVSVAIVDSEPVPWLPGSVKHGSRAAWVLAARTLGVEEVLFRDRAGFLLEANRSNLVAVVDGVAVTPPADGRVLSGVSRQALLECGFPIEEARVRDGSFQELYLCSTLKELAPVVMDGILLEGPVGRALGAAFTPAES